MNIFDKIYNGRVNPVEEFTPSENKEYQEHNKVVDEYLDYFKFKLSKEDFRKLEDLNDAIFIREDVLNRYAFSYGFKMATLMMIEVFVSL